MDKKALLIHGEFLGLLIVLIVGFYLLNSKIESHAVSHTSKADNVSSRLDQLFQTVNNLIKKK
jgi:hypothetical protein